MKIMQAIHKSMLRGATSALLILCVAASLPPNPETVPVDAGAKALSAMPDCAMTFFSDSKEDSNDDHAQVIFASEKTTIGSDNLRAFRYMTPTHRAAYVYTSPRTYLRHRQFLV